MASWCSENDPDEQRKYNKYQNHLSGLLTLVERQTLLEWIGEHSQTGQAILEQRLYTNFIFKCNSIEQLLQFEGDKAVYGLNFSDLQESRLFRQSIEKFVHNRDRRNRQNQNQTQLSLITTTTEGIVCQPSTKSKSKKKKRLSRSDIGLPNVSTFRHLSHFDISPRKTFVSNAARAVPKLDPMIRNLLESIGEAAEKLNKDEQQFVCDFIQKQNGITNVQKELHKTDKTMKFRTLSTGRFQPEQQANEGSQFFHSSVPKAKIACPPPPPPPPPPPTLLISNIDTFPPPPPPADVGQLGDQTGAMRSDLLSQIQQGKKLKSVGMGDTWPKSAHITAPLAPTGGGIAVALAKALAERREHLKPDEEQSGNEDDDASNSNDADWD